MMYYFERIDLTKGSVTLLLVYTHNFFFIYTQFFLDTHNICYSVS